MAENNAAENAPTPNRIRFVTPTELPSLYSNNARVMLSYNDFRIYFSESMADQAGPLFMAPGEISQTPNSVAIERLCLVISPEFARSLYEVLGSSIEKFEAKFGKLRPKPSNASEANAPSA